MTKLSELLTKDDPLTQAFVFGGHQFPGIWRYMMPQEFLGLKLPAESRASCMNCPKACYDKYRADYRCCTYHPRVPNYLLGLAAQQPAGRASVQGLIDRGMLLPEGMHYAPGQWFDYLEDLQNESFGKSEKVLCPHLEQETGYCRIHAFRNSVCSTFYCYKDHGDLGDKFWGHVQTLGSQIEVALAQWALEEVGFDVQKYFQVFDRLAPQVPKLSTREGWIEEALMQLWGSWWGREFELLEACAAQIVRHRDKLWEIANAFPIRDSHLFDKALVRAVPRRLKDQVDPEDQDLEAGEAARPRDLWLNCLKTYHRLWDLPEGAYEMTQRVEVIANPKLDAEELYYQDKPYCLLYYLRRSSKTLEWRLFLSAEQFQLLRLFQQEALELDWSLLRRPEFQNVPEGKEFLAQMLAQKVLVRRQYH